MARRRGRHAAALVVLALVILLGRAWVDRALATVPPRVAARQLSLFDTRPVAVRTTVFWQKIPRLVSIDQLLNDHTLWRQMHFDDWDKVPRPVREKALARMLLRYRHLLNGPSTWLQLSVFDWDDIPHPIRAFAYQRMVQYWTEYYDVGDGYVDDARLVAQTVSAIVMAESWFEHRGLHVGASGNRDVGLAACSNHCREVLEELAVTGAVDFRLKEDEYFDPWNGTRVAAVWFRRELERAGDLNLAVAAYHRGLTAARLGVGAYYAANVRRLRRRYITGQNAPPAWAFLLRQVEEDAGTLPRTIVAEGELVAGT
jgi:hypothetical protein